MNVKRQLAPAVSRISTRNPIPTRPAAFGLPSDFTDAQIRAALVLRDRV
jgi:hypothetical protein